MPDFSFHPGFSGTWLLVVAAAAILLVAVFYRQAYRALRPAQWAWLLGLRVAAIAIVLLLLFRPVLSFQRELDERSTVVLLIDHSASMGIADDAAGATRLEQATDCVRDWLPQLRGSFEPQLVAFADAAVHLEDAQQLASLQASGAATSLSKALLAATQLQATRRVEAVLVFSDGVHNSAGDPRATARMLGAAVHTIGTGNTLRDRRAYRDMRVSHVDSPPQMSVDHRAQVQGYVEATGFGGRVVEALLEEDGRVVDRQELVLDDLEGAQEIGFEFTPAAKGLHTYKVRVPPPSDEKIPENNERATSSLVVDARIRVLYLEGTLRAEYGALVGRFLSRDPNLEFCALVQTRPNVFMQRSNIEDLQLDAIPSDPQLLETFDVFIIGDLDSSYFQAGQMELIRDRVRAGAGLLMTGGYHSLGPGGYAATPLGEILPVAVGERDVGQVTEPFLPQLTAEGRRHSIFANITSFFPSPTGAAEFDGLPPLEGCVRVRAARPACTVLAIHPSQQAAGRPLPVLAVQPVAAGRAAVFTGDTTRNWHQTLRSQDRETPFLRFWGQTVRWLAGRSDEFETEAGIAATTDKSYYEPGATITISAVVRSEDGEAGTAAQVTAFVEGPGPGISPFALSPVAGPAGHFQASFEPPGSGRYEISVAAQLDGKPLSAETLQVDVGRPNLEFDRLDLDEQLLSAIANETGGRYAHIRTADRILEQLKRRREARQVQYEMPLAWPPLLWLGLVGVLSAEWLLRRKHRLR